MRALILLLSLIAGQVSAAEVGYELEVIIFEDTTGVYNHAETWLPLAGPQQQADETEPANDPVAAKKKKSAESKPLHQFLKPSQYRLNKQAERLVKNPDFRVLVHTAWKQPGLDRDQAFAVAIDSASKPGDETKAAEQTAGKTEPDSFIKGEITLVMSRYLHVNAELEYFRTTPGNSPVFTDQDPAVAAEASPYEKFPVIFERRMRSREVHYIDHPLVGMIVLATPYKIETETGTDQPAKTYKTL